MVLTTPMGLTQTHCIELVLLNHTCMRGPSVTRMRDFLRYFIFLDFFGGFLRYFEKISKLLRLLLKVTEVNIEHQKWPNISTNSVKSFFVCEKGKKNVVRRPKPSTGAKSNFLSDIRHKDFRSDHPTWILKRGGLASSGQRLIFSIGRTK